MVRNALLALVPLVLLSGAPVDAGENSVQISVKPRGLVWGDLSVPIETGPGIDRVRLLVNGVTFGEAGADSAAFTVPIGKYLRRLRIRAIGLDREGRAVAEDEMAVNDPQPPFRIRLYAPQQLPESGPVELNANVLAPLNLPIREVEFWVGETRVAVDRDPPYSASFDVSLFPGERYARAVARARGSLEANDIWFWSDVPHESIEVIVKHIPMSVFGDDVGTLRKDDLTVRDGGQVREIDALVPAEDQPLNVIMLIDTSESMLEELPVIQQAAKQFARSVVRENDRLAVVAFHQRVYWLTGFTSDLSLVDRAIDRLDSRGQTHLYDAVISMLYELQKMPGRKALVVLSDGMNFGGTFELDHLVHYARYSGVPIYPIVKNRWLSRLMRFRLAMMEARRFAEIARESGASYFIIQSPAELPKVYQAIAEELRNQYVLVFRSESTGTDAWHPLSVETNRRVRLRVPRGYFE